MSGPGSADTGPAKAIGVARWLVPSVGSLGLVFILLFMFVMQSRFLEDSDSGWHIRTGDLIRATGRVPVADPFSFTMSGHQWFAWEWLSDWMMSLLHSAFGLSGVVVAAFAVLTAAHALLYQMMRHRRTDPIVTLVALSAAALFSAGHWLARPHLLSILFVVVWSMLVEAYRRSRSRAIWGVPPLIALWANLHGAFVITFVMIVVYAVGEWLEAAARGEGRTAGTMGKLRTYALVAALSVVAGAATPYGADLYRHIVRYLGDTALLSQIAEFRSPNFHEAAGRIIELMMVAGLVAAMQAVRRGRYVEPLLVGLWVHFSLQSTRHITLAAAVMAPIIAEQWHHLLGEVARATGADLAVQGLAGRLRRFVGEVAAIDCQVNNAALYAGLVLFFAVLFGNARVRNDLVINEFPRDSQPVAAAQFIERERAAGRLTGRVFAPDQFGGYLIYRFEGRLKVFFDGRSDFYNQGPALGDALKIGRVRPGWDELLDKYDIQWMLLAPESPIAVTALSSGRWVRAYGDPTALVLTRSGDRAAGALSGTN
jgi:hypothetical protein